MHVEFAVIKHIIVETVWMLVTVAAKHAYVFLQGLLDTKMNALAIGIGKHMMNAQMHVEFVVPKLIILEIVLIHVSVAVRHVYVFLQGFLETKMNALAIGIGKHKMAGGEGSLTPDRVFGNKDECPCYRDRKTQDGIPKCP
ncbi:Gibberellin regulated protein [Cynara cardunculus var. scolymus]|uniref:Gibberellin regulated protein n=1 Tax=Cynara cardunculus var. scolymus TaxID=59895 RepID=A0A124SIE4_CYNCS|nr:Gibberellin regulated protein [Cynara cardunculus var. scolymus]